MTVGLMIYEDHLENLVVSKIYIFQEIITLDTSLKSTLLKRREEIEYKRYASYEEFQVYL